MMLPRHGPDAQRSAIDVHRFDPDEFADDERHQVRGHLDRVGENDLFLAGPGQYRLAHDGRVGDGGEPLIYYEGSLENRFERRLIPAGEGTASVGGLEL